MVDELDTTKNDGDTLDLDNEEEKDIDDVDPSKIIDEPEETEEVEDSAVEETAASPEEDPFGFGGFGELDENGEFVPPSTDDDDEDEDEISDDLF